MSYDVAHSRYGSLNLTTTFYLLNACLELQAHLKKRTFYHLYAITKCFLDQGTLSAMNNAFHLQLCILGSNGCFFLIP